MPPTTTTKGEGGDILVSVRILGVSVGMSLYPPYFLILWEEFYQSSVDTSLGQAKELIHFKVTGGFGLLNFLHRCDRFLNAQYLLNQCMKCHQICMDVSLGQAYELIRFW